MKARSSVTRRIAASALWLGLTPALAQSPPDAPAATATTADATDPAQGLRLNLSGFGTLGWARSNRTWAYQRSIDDGGSARADSVLGAQADLQFDSRWSAALQLRLAPSNRDETAWRLRPSWAFVAWRPDNDWLLRAGRLRLPAYLNSEQLDVAATYNAARLPAEVYAVLPPDNLDSLDITRSWSIGDGELSLDVYGGRSKQTLRAWVRDGIGEELSTGANFIRMTTEAQGVVATWLAPDTKARLGLHRVVVTPPAGMAVVEEPSGVPLGPGVGFWQTAPGMPGPGVETVAHLKSWYLAGGVEFSPAPGWRVTMELNRVRPVNTQRSIDTRGGYLSLTRQIGRWSPYLTFGRLKSSGSSLAWARTLDETTVPSAVPGSTLLNASMRASADAVPVYDQRAWSFGGAYALSPTHRLKAEWLHTRAEVSSMFDLAPGEKLFRPRSIDVLSVNYSFTF
ncbi:MAG: hypothetical protein L6Q75_19220 [Burkholderiaceae bacterium]|nr:hypothetical protein [Burkholderiaceae bacterium]